VAVLFSFVIDPSFIHTDAAPLVNRRGRVFRHLQLFLLRHFSSVASLRAQSGLAASEINVPKSGRQNPIGGSRWQIVAAKVRLQYSGTQWLI
jgi:hypothetical protein